MNTILVVDDMALCREPIAEALRKNGYEAICAADGSEALSFLREQRPDLVLLDVNMPELDGLAVLRTMRRDSRLKGIPVILLTDKADRECIAQAAEQGVQGYLLKSRFSLDELFARVGACLGEPTVVSVAQETQTERSGYSQWREKTEQTPTASSTSSRSVRPSKPHGRATSDGESASQAPTGPPIPDDVRSLDDLSPVITKAQLFKLVNEGLELQPLGPTVQNVMAVTGSASCCADDVAKAVTQDQALSIRILKLANSTAYSRGRPVDSVKEAVGRIGIQEVRSMVMTLGVLQQYEGGAGEHIDAHLFWEHSIACGLIASAISVQRQTAKADDAFLWGMVHDVGRLILLDHVSDQYGHAWDAADQLSLPLEAVEAKLMMLDHCDILEQALEHWQFPREFIAPVVNHHHSIHAIKRLGPQHVDAAATVALANRVAHALMLGSSGNEVIYPLNDLVDGLRLEPTAITKLEETIPNETRDLKITMLARANEDGWPDFVTQVKERIAPEFRPLCVSAEPNVDAHRIFCERVGSTSDDEPPNIGVVYLRNADELAKMTEEYETQENARGTSNTPVVLIVGRGKVDAEQPWLSARRHAILSVPVRISGLIRTIGELLG